MRYPHFVIAALLMVSLTFDFCSAQRDPDNSLVDYSLPDSAIASYLEKNQLPPGYKGDKVISVFKVVGESYKKDTTYTYLWTYTSAYSLEKGELKEGATVNLPVVLKALVKPDHHRILSIQQPETGDRYTASLQTLFPAGMLRRINLGQGNLPERSRNLVKEYYHLK